MNTTTNPQEKHLNEFQINILKRSIGWITPQSNYFIARFYSELFRTHPQTSILLRDLSISQLHDRIMAGIRIVLHSLGEPHRLNSLIRDLKIFQIPGGIPREHYDAMTASFLVVLSEFAEDAWSPVLQEAWKGAVKQVKSVILEEPEEGFSGKFSEHMIDKKTNKVKIDKRILIVDDDPDVRHSLRSLFISSGYLCHEAENGAIALDYLTILPIDLVVTDNKMPVLSGLQFLQQLAQNSEQIKPPIILLTGNLERSLLKKARDAGAYAILGKPYSWEELLSTVRKALNHKPNVQ